MSDGLVRKSDVLKILPAYFAQCVERVESDEECLRVLQYVIDLSMLIEDMKEVDNG